MCTFQSKHLEERSKRIGASSTFLSGIKMMYHHYSSSKKEEITRLQTQLHGDDYQLGNNRNEQM